MTNLGDILSDLNPESAFLLGQKAVNLTRNVLENLNLSEHTPQEILDALRENGIGITIPSFYNLYTEITGTQVRSQRIKYVNLSYVPSESILEPALYELPTRYRIIQYVEYEDLETGVIIQREFALDTDSLSSIADMQQQSIAAIQSRYPAKVLTIRTVGGYINR